MIDAWKSVRACPADVSIPLFRHRRYDVCADAETDEEGSDWLSADHCCSTA
ncbi:MAG: hypothetical protein ABW128_20130 [Rhizorhabdus sp.]